MSIQISSRLTPFYKFVVPALMIVGFAVGGFVMWLHPERQNSTAGVPLQHQWVPFVAVGALALLVLWRLLANLKQVELDGDWLVISNFRDEIRVPLANVEKISGRSLSDPPRYTITFVEETEFGRRVTFIAPRCWRWVKRFSDPDEIVELRSAWESARADAERR